MGNHLLHLLLLCIFCASPRAFAQTPANDNLANATTLTGTNVTVTASNAGATTEPGEPNHAGYPAAHSIWFVWTAPGAGTALADLTNSVSGSLVAIYQGKYVNSLSLVSSNAFGNADATGRTTFPVTSGTTYEIAVDNASGSVGQIQLNVQFTTTDFPLAITGQPGDQTVVERRDSPSFVVGAVSATLLTYQWQFNGTNLVGETNATLNLPNVKTNQAGVYQVLVTNGGGSVTSNPATLTVLTRPVNDDFVNRIVLTGTNVTATGSTVNATWETGEPYGGQPTVWWSWTAPRDGPVVVDMKGSATSFQPILYTGNAVDVLNQVTLSYALNPDNSTYQGRFVATAGTTYQVQIGYPGYQGNIQLNIQLLTTDLLPTITQQPGDQTVVERRDSPSFAVAAVSATPLTYQWQFNGTNLVGETNATLNFPNVKTNQAGVYQVIVGNGGGSVTSRQATLTVYPRPPNDDFVNRIVLTGTNVTATGSNVHATWETGEPYGGEPTVWWSWTAPRDGPVIVDMKGSATSFQPILYTGNAVDVLNQVTLSYALNPDNSTYQGRFVATAGTTYQVQIGYPGYQGNIQFQITALAPPEIVGQPQDQVAAPGEDVPFIVVAQSVSPLSYQWRFNGTNLNGETNSALLLSNVATNQLGQYSVVVSNDLDSVTSRAASLTFGDVIRGQVTDALNRNPLPGVTVWVGTLTNVTDQGGNYRIVGVKPEAIKAEFDANIRTGPAPLAVQFIDESSVNAVSLNATTNGYFPYFTTQVQISSDQVVTNNFSMSPILPTNTMRLVLNWQAEPRDLDGNLVTPVIQGQSYHIYYQTGSRGSLTSVPYAGLDFDYTNGFGPETITIQQFFGGTYEYFVHKYAGVGSIADSYGTTNPGNNFDWSNLTSHSLPCFSLTAFNNPERSRFV